MNIDCIIYDFKAMQLASDWTQQEQFLELYYSIKTLRDHSNIPVYIFYQTKIDLDEYDYNKKYNVFFDFSNVKIRECEDNLDREYVRKENYEKICSMYGNVLVADKRTVFGLDPQKVFADLENKNWKCFENRIQIFSKDFVGNSEYDILPEKYVYYDSLSDKIEHSWQGCTLPNSIICYTDNIEKLAPSNYWNCYIKDRIKETASEICQFCCRII